MLRTQQRNVVLSCRVPLSTYNLLGHISEHTGLKKSTLQRAAITQWLQKAPEDLPLDLKVEIARVNIQHQIETIKNLRWAYHQERYAQLRLREIEKEGWLPPHTQHIIKQLETQIITLHQQLDQWIRNQYQKGEDP